jgi:hypothetical protein
MFLVRHLDNYVKKVFKDIDNPLSLDDITLKLHDLLITEQRPGVLLGTRTLIKLLEKYDSPLLERVGDSHLPVYVLSSGL